MVEPKDGPATADRSAKPGPWRLLSSWLVSATLHMLVLVALAWRLVAVPGGGLGITLNCRLGTVEYFEDGEDGSGAEPPALLSQITAELPAATALENNRPRQDPPPVEPAGVLRTSATLPDSAALAAQNIGSGVTTTTEPGDGGQRPARLGIGGEARTGLFGVSGQGRKFVYVFDRSASMGGAGRNALSAAKAQLLASLGDLDGRHQFQIIFYNERPLSFGLTGHPGRLVYATPRNKALAAKFVNSIVADGATRHEEALEMALRLRPDVVFFLSDADEPKLWAGQLAKIHRLAAGVTINAIEFGFGPQTESDNFLVRLAWENGGEHGYVDVSQLYHGPRT